MSSNSSSPAAFTDFADGWLVDEAPVASARERAREFGITSVSPATARFLTFLTSSLQAQAVVEVGTGTGVSGAALVAGMTPGGMLTSIDTEAEYQRYAREPRQALGHETSRARLIAGRALDVLPRMSDGAYDVVVVDSDRSEYPAILAQAKRLLRIGGVVAFIGIGEDDMVADPSRRDAEASAVKETATLVRDDSDWVPSLLTEGDGSLVACLVRRD